MYDSWIRRTYSFFINWRCHISISIYRFRSRIIHTMNTLQKLILAKVTSSGEVSHDKITTMYPADRTADEIHALYMADLISLRSDGMLYRKY